MGIKFKTLTIDCQQCDDCKVNDNNQFVCHWGDGKPKVMFPAKGKKIIMCKLKKDI